MAMMSLCPHGLWLLVQRQRRLPLPSSLGVAVTVGAKLGAASRARHCVVAPGPGRRGQRRMMMEMAVKKGSRVVVRAGRDGDDEPTAEVDVSVFRFTLGIPGFDDADLPRLVGIIFGTLIILNHAVSLDSMTGAQLTSEAFGLFLAAVAITLPFVGRRLKGGEAEQEGNKVAGRSSMFALADTLTDSQKQELAWGSYALLRNTKTSAVIVWYNGEVVCARGSWDVGDGGGGGAQALTFLLNKLKKTPFMEASSPLYVSNGADTKGWPIIPKDAKSLLVQPFIEFSSRTGNGGLVLISYDSRSYNSKDRTWAALLAQKFSQIMLN